MKRRSTLRSLVQRSTSLVIVVAVAAIILGAGAVSAPTYVYDGADNPVAARLRADPNLAVELGERADHGNRPPRAARYDDPANLARASAYLAGYRLAPQTTRALAGGGDDVAGALCRSNSFVPATLVLMADGSTKPIADVDIGDMVMATDPETGERGARRVTDTIVGDGVKELVDIEIDGNVITATDRHPFWVDDEGRWVDAEDLQAGDVLLLADGDTVAVDAVSERTGVRRVHNLTVEGIHTYYVLAGRDPVLVHNCIVPGNERAVAQRIAQGHAYDKHVLTQGQFPGIRTQTQFADVVEGVITNAEHTRHLQHGRMGYWRDGVVTIFDPRSADLGTTFAPRSGIDYFWNSLK